VLYAEVSDIGGMLERYNV